jgi:hypothetical protein
MSIFYIILSNFYSFYVGGRPSGLNKAWTFLPLFQIKFKKNKYKKINYWKNIIIKGIK